MSRPFPLISSFSWVYAIISCAVIIPGVVSLLIFGLKPGIDFAGGTLLEFEAGKTEKSAVEAVITASLPAGAKVVRFDAAGESRYALRLSPLDDSGRQALSASLSAQLSGYKETALVSVGPTIGKELVIKTVTAVALASILIAIYLAFRFQSFQYGLSAIVATLHDVLVLLGVFSILGHFFGVEVDTLFVTALLTVVSFSVHDTVVVYDRIRERRHRVLRESLTETIDHAVIETLTRSLRNSLAVVLVLFTLFVLGGATLKWFAFALLVGTISGTYSSTFVALPLLLVWEKLLKRKA